jgi:hypothetical protein
VEGCKHSNKSSGSIEGTQFIELAEQLLVSQEGLYCSVSFFFFFLLNDKLLGVKNLSFYPETSVKFLYTISKGL